MYQCQKLIVITVVALTSLFFLSSVSVSAADKREQLLKRINELEKSKQEFKKTEEKSNKNNPVIEETVKYDEIILRYEEKYQNCKGGNTFKCAQIMYNLCGLYFDKERDSYKQALQKFKSEIEVYDSINGGLKPTKPLLMCPKALELYKRFVSMYPDCNLPGNNEFIGTEGGFVSADGQYKITNPHMKPEKNEGSDKIIPPPKGAGNCMAAESYFQIGSILLLQSDFAGSINAFQTVCDSYPGSTRAPFARKRLAEFCGLEGDYNCELSHYDSIKAGEGTPALQEEVCYKKGVCYYNIGEFEKALNQFFFYIKKSDAKDFTNKTFRNYVLEYLAICFSEMPSGVDLALQRFEQLGHQPYEEYIIYMIGFKNVEHGQKVEAKKNLAIALVKYPYSSFAAKAQQLLARLE